MILRMRTMSRGEGDGEGLALGADHVAVDHRVAERRAAAGGRVEGDQPLLHPRAREPLDARHHLVGEDHVARLHALRGREEAADHRLVPGRRRRALGGRRGRGRGRDGERRGHHHGACRPAPPAEPSGPHPCCAGPGDRAHPHPRARERPPRRGASRLPAARGPHPFRRGPARARLLATPWPPAQKTNPTPRSIWSSAGEALASFRVQSALIGHLRDRLVGEAGHQVLAGRGSGRAGPPAGSAVVQVEGLVAEEGREQLLATGRDQGLITS